MSSRIGKFRLSRRDRMLAEDCGYFDLVVNAIFDGKFVVRCENLFHMDCLEYIAVDIKGNTFDEIAAGEEAPMYDCVVDAFTGEDGEVNRVSVSWSRL